MIEALKSGFLEFLKEKGEVKKITELTLEVALMAVDDLISRSKENNSIPSLKYNLTNNRLNLIKERIKQLEVLKTQLNDEYHMLDDNPEIPPVIASRDRINIFKTISNIENDLFKLKDKQFNLIANTQLNYGSIDSDGVFKDRDVTYPSLISSIYKIFQNIGFGHFTIEEIDKSFDENNISVASLFGGE